MKKLLIEIVSIFVVFVLIMSSNISVFAITATEYNNQKNELNNQKEEVSDQIDDAQSELSEIKAEKSQTLKEVEELISQISDYESQVNNLKSDVNNLQKEIDDTQKEIDEKQKEYDEQSQLLDQRMIAVYENGQTSYLDFILSSNSLVEFISNYYLAAEIASCDTDLIDSIEKTKNEIQDEKTALETKKADVSSKLKEVETINTKLKASQTQKNAKVAALSDQEKETEKLIEELQSHESSISNKIAQMKKEYDAQNSPKQNTSPDSNTSSYGFGWPVANHSIGTKYGVAGSYWSSGYHTGVDFPVPSGTSVFSIGNGKVFDTGYNSAYGNYVEIYHGNNIYSFYAHASSVQVSVGQTVTKGQQIMLSGATGNVSGAHLHFEIRTPGYKYANCVNPAPYLP